jgi:hypothetical protein
MADVTVKRVDEMESIWGGSFVRARAALGARSFGMNIRNFPPNFDEYWEHNHVDPSAADGEEEVYTVLDGSATLHVDGEQYVLEPGVFARVGAAERRKDHRRRRRRTAPLHRRHSRAGVQADGDRRARRTREPLGLGTSPSRLLEVAV